MPGYNMLHLYVKQLEPHLGNIYEQHLQRCFLSHHNSPLFEEDSVSRSPSLLLLVLLWRVPSTAHHLPTHLEITIVNTVIAVLLIIFDFVISTPSIPTCSGVAIGAGMLVLLVAVLFGVVRFCTFASLLPVVVSCS